MLVQPVLLGGGLLGGVDPLLGPSTGEERGHRQSRQQQQRRMNLSQEMPVTPTRATRPTASPITEWTELLRTQSDHRLLPPSRLEPLLHAVAAAIDAHGGVYEHAYVSLLVTVQRTE